MRLEYGYDSSGAEAPAVGGGGDDLSFGKYQGNYAAPPLTAGEVDDNAKFAEYLEFLRGYQGPPVNTLDVSERMFVQVTGADQKPVAGANVHIYQGQDEVFAGRTTSDGRVAFFPRLVKGGDRAQSYRVVAEAGGAKVEGVMQRGSAGSQVALPGAARANEPVALDVVFLLDATGSMSDEIQKLQQTIHSIARQLEQLPGGTELRLGLVAYRDIGEEYLTRKWDLTSSVEQFAANLDQVSADGGGDTYEAVNAGLHDALMLPGWQQGQETGHLRLLFLVGDAAPHLDYANDYKYPELLSLAVAQGVKIFPIGCSGLDSLGEYVFRQFAQITQGKFVFLTYENGISGAPGVATSNHVEDFSVSNLDALLVRLVSAEVANQNSGVAPLPKPAEVRVVETVPAPVSTLAERLRPLVEQAQQWGWVLLLVALALFWWRERQKARVAAAVAAPSPEMAPAGTPLPTEDLAEMTRRLTIAHRARVRGLRPRRPAAMSRSIPAGYTASLRRRPRDTQPLPPRT